MILYFQLMEIGYSIKKKKKLKKIKKSKKINDDIKKKKLKFKKKVCGLLKNNIELSIVFFVKNSIINFSPKNKLDLIKKFFKKISVIFFII